MPDQIATANETREPQRYRCAAQIYKRDQLRYTGHGKTGFSMHYARCQCSKPARADSEWCGTHAKLAAQGYGIFRCSWARNARPVAPQVEAGGDG